MDSATFQIEVIQRLTAIETIIKNQDYKGVSVISNEALTLSRKNEEDIKEIKDRNKWYFRTIIGCILTTLIGLLISVLKIN